MDNNNAVTVGCMIYSPLTKKFISRDPNFLFVEVGEFCTGAIWISEHDAKIFLQSLKDDFYEIREEFQPLGSYKVFPLTIQLPKD